MMSLGCGDEYGYANPQCCLVAASPVTVYDVIFLKKIHKLSFTFQFSLLELNSLPFTLPYDFPDPKTGSRMIRD